MKKPDQIIYVDSDEISLFLAESILSSLDLQLPLNFFSEMEEAFAFIKTMSPPIESRLTIFINAAILMGEQELVQQLKEALHPLSFRFCLLSSLPDAKQREKDFIEEIGLSCYIEKPLTEEKLLQALALPY